MQEQVEGLFRQMLGADEVPEKVTEVYEQVKKLYDRIDAAVPPTAYPLIAMQAGYLGAPQQDPPEADRVTEPEKPQSAPGELSEGDKVICRYGDKNVEGEVVSVGEKKVQVMVDGMDDFVEIEKFLVKRK